MCTSIVEIVGAEGAGKGADGWFDLTRAVVSYDHPHHAFLEEAITIDFLNDALGADARVAVELTLDSANSSTSSWPAMSLSPAKRRTVICMAPV